MVSSRLPQGFLWGAATSSHQVEGSNIKNDWYIWEKQAKIPSAGQACRHYDMYCADFALAKSLSHNAHRFSIEWSRVHLGRGRWDNSAIEHYRKVLGCLREKGLEPVVTLWHFTLPGWLFRQKGWESPEASGCFLEYVEKMVIEFKDYVRYWVVMNEPLIYVYQSYLAGKWPPGRKSLRLAFRVSKNLAKTYIKSYKIIRSIYSGREVFAGPAKNFIDFCPCSFNNFGQNSLAAFLRDRVFNVYFIDYLVKRNALDFIGVNYYRRDFIRAGLFDLAGKECRKEHHKLARNSLGWFIYPQGLEKILLRLKKYRRPVIITENGTTGNDDKDYSVFLEEHIRSVFSALSKGVDIRGYFWWSLLDNYEWDKGFKAKFGLAGITRNFKRIVKPFAYKYKDIICLNSAGRMSPQA